jgi:hypothetical protein
MDARHSASSPVSFFAAAPRFRMNADNKEARMTRASQ